MKTTIKQHMHMFMVENNHQVKFIYLVATSWSITGTRAANAGEITLKSPKHRGVHRWLVDCTHNECNYTEGDSIYVAIMIMLMHGEYTHHWHHK